MRWGILGPLVVADDAGTEIRVPAGRLRVLLVALLTRANHVVPVDELVEFVWDGAPPASAVRTMRVHVVRLRHALGPLAATRILTQPPGYLCRVGEDELDVLRFEKLCGQARSAARERDWPIAAGLLEEALGLWRGTPLADAPSELLRQREVPGLDQLHVQAIEDHIDAGMHLGRHEQLIPGLRELTARYPLRERSYSQLIRALARTGRRAEALEVYQDARHVLADELGIEPGPELRELQERILAGDGESASAPRAEAVPASPSAQVPRQLPAAPGHFTGRRAELEALTGLLAQAGQAGGSGGMVVISAVDGMAGVGKTALAVHAAHRLAGHFPGGQLFIDLHAYTRGYEPRTPGEALEALLRTLGVPPQQIPEDTDERAALYRQHLADSRSLIVLDNAASEAQVRPLLPASAGCLVLVTSRRRLKGLDDARTLSLDVLPRADAITLLRTVAGPGRVLADDPALAEIAELCGRLPLALRIAAALLRHRPAWTPRHLTKLLRDQDQRVPVFFDGERDLGAAFDLSYRTLDDARRHLFRCLGLIPGPDFEVYAAAALAGTGPSIAASMLQGLVDHNLVIEYAQGRYRLHDLLRAYARTLASRDPRGDQEAAREGLLDYYQHTAIRADALITALPRPALVSHAPAHAPDLPGPEAAWAWLRAERASLLAAVDHAATGTDDKRVIALTSGLATLLRTDGPWSQAIALHTAAVTAACRLGDNLGRAMALTDLGQVRRLSSDYPGAGGDQQEALELFLALGNRLGQAAALTELGLVRRLTGDYPSAAHDLRQALALYQALEIRVGQAAALTWLGLVRRLTADYPEAARNDQEALHLYRALGDRAGQATVLTELGKVRGLTGDHQGAVGDYQEALELFLALGDRAGQATALTWLGEVRRLTGEYTSAVRGLRQALGLFRELGSRNGQATALAHLGQVRMSTGDCAGAVHDLRQALELFRQIGVRGNEAWVMNHYAAAIAATGDYTRALAVYHDASRLAREVRQPDDEALAREGIGECHLHAGNIPIGITHLRQALEVFQRLAMTADSGRVQARLAELGSEVKPLPLCPN